MPDNLSNLVELQHTDIEIARLLAEVIALPKQVAAVEAKLSAGKSRLEMTTRSLAEEETLRRRCESDIQDKRQKIKRYRQQIDAVKTDDQLKALEHEVKFAEADTRRIEDSELESMERTEGLESARTAASEHLAEQTLVVERERLRATEGKTRNLAEVARLRGVRDSLRGQVEEGVLAIYDRVSRSRGTGIANGIGQKCSACQMMLRPQKWNELRDGVTMTCESCGRLLYYDHTGKLPALPSAVR